MNVCKGMSESSYFFWLQVIYFRFFGMLANSTTMYCLCHGGKHVKSTTKNVYLQCLESAVFVLRKNPTTPK
jgi:hypothetical protein